MLVAIIMWLSSFWERCIFRMGPSNYYHSILIFENDITCWLFGSIYYHSFKYYHFQHIMSFYISNVSEAGVTCQKGFNSLAVCQCDTALRIRSTAPAFNTHWTYLGGFLGVRWHAELLQHQVSGEKDHNRWSILPTSQLSSNPIAKWLCSHSIMQRPKLGKWNVAERVPPEPSWPPRCCSLLLLGCAVMGASSLEWCSL